MVKRFYQIAIVGLLSVSMIGCTVTQQWMTGGAVAGGLIGGGLANRHGKLNTAQGALVGAATGAAAGALIGDIMAEREVMGLQGQLADLERQNQELRDQLTRAQSELERLRVENQRLTARIAELEGRPVDRVVELEVELLADVLFAPGSARLTEGGREILGETAQRIQREHPNSYVSIQGHTDSQPIRVSGWDDNWQLGSERALAVLRYLINQGVAPERSSAETYGEYRPVAPNISPDNMRMNRRAVIIVHTGPPAGVLPAPGAAEREPGRRPR